MDPICFLQKEQKIHDVHVQFHFSNSTRLSIVAMCEIINEEEEISVLVAVETVKLVFLQLYLCTNLTNLSLLGVGKQGDTYEVSL